MADFGSHIGFYVIFVTMEMLFTDQDQTFL